MSACNLGSSTGATPTLRSVVVKGYGATAAWPDVSALNKVDLPAFGRPTIPSVVAIGLLAEEDDTEDDAQRTQGTREGERLAEHPPA